MNWIGYAACIGAWVFFVHHDHTAPAWVALISAIICSVMSEPVIKLTFRGTNQPQSR